MGKKVPPEEVPTTGCEIKQIRVNAKTPAAKRLAQTGMGSAGMAVSRKNGKRRKAIDEAIRWFIKLDRKVGGPKLLRAFQQWKDKDTANALAYSLIERDCSIARILGQNQARTPGVDAGTERCTNSRLARRLGTDSVSTPETTTAGGAPSSRSPGSAHSSVEGSRPACSKRALRN